jgi:phage replication O-like protein O
MNEELQIENGNYTRIVNKVIDELVKLPLLGAELAICLFVIRKTYGYQKTEDQISITQFEKGVERSRPTVVKALKNLQLVNILKLVKTGNSIKMANCWSFNKYYDTWKLVKIPKLVKQKMSTSKAKAFQLVKTPKHTKEITKENTKEILQADACPSNDIVSIINIFKGINPTINYGNKTTRKSCERLIKRFGLEGTLGMATVAVSVQGQKYAPTITTPYLLETKLAELKIYLDKQKSNQITQC